MEHKSNVAPTASLRPLKGPTSGSKLWGPVEQSMDKSLLEGTWQEFEALIRDTIGSDFRWRVCPQDTHSNREMIVSLILEDIKRNNGVFPERNTFIEKE